MDDSNLGPGGGGCGGECELNEDGVCEVCAVCSFKSDGKKQFPVPASDGSRDSLVLSPHSTQAAAADRALTRRRSMDDSNLASGGGGGCGGGGECELNEDGVCAVCSYKSDGKKQFPVSDSSRDSLYLRMRQEVAAVPPCSPCDHQALNEHVEPSNDYTMLPGCFVTRAQDEKVLALARTRKPKIPLHVASMSKINVNLKDLSFYIPLQLVLNHFKDETTEATIKLKAADGSLYGVGASKHPDERVVLVSGWDSFVVSHHIQEKDLLIFISTEQSRLEVIILDPSGHEKNPSCTATRNPCSGTQETSGNSVHSVDPPPREVFDLSSSTPREVFDLSSSDDDDIVREGTEESCRVQKRITRNCAKTQKIASTSSPSAKSGPGARKRKLEVRSKLLSKNLNGPSHRPYILSLHPRNSLPCHVVKKIKEKVEEIRSELPIFVKVINTSSVADTGGSRTCQMLFCVDYADAWLPGKRQMLFLQLEGKTRLWETTLDVYDYGVLRKKIISQEGWKEFCRENGLKVGDICLFKLEDTNPGSLKMTVYLIRRSQIEL